MESAIEYVDASSDPAEYLRLVQLVCRPGYDLSRVLSQVRLTKRMVELRVHGIQDHGCTRTKLTAEWGADIVGHITYTRHAGDCPNAAYDDTRHKVVLEFEAEGKRINLSHDPVPDIVRFVDAATILQWELACNTFIAAVMMKLNLPLSDSR